MHMSPTLLEGVAVVVVIVVAWQIGVRIAPDIIDMVQRAIDQLNGGNPSSNVTQKPNQNLTIDSSAKKEQAHDPEKRHD
jgi:hypothetical protein